MYRTNLEAVDSSEWLQLQVSRELRKTCPQVYQQIEHDKEFQCWCLKSGKKSDSESDPQPSRQQSNRSQGLMRPTISSLNKAAANTARRRGLANAYSAGKTETNFKWSSSLKIVEYEFKQPSYVADRAILRHTPEHDANENGEPVQPTPESTAQHEGPRRRELVKKLSVVQNKKNCEN
ncbi:hypothetical protein HF086_014628 [Spodoptera exigua]|uniref:Uncharacterized protein n=1 Tax=Spodoptera exigua TaxID=7107 RepID=A0A922SAT0_SPOEX|nr:hypothetical protein HF086_014628 [Spodoptera exigua]